MGLAKHVARLWAIGLACALIAAMTCCRPIPTQADFGEVAMAADNDADAKLAEVKADLADELAAEPDAGVDATPDALLGPDADGVDAADAGPDAADTGADVAGDGPDVADAGPDAADLDADVAGVGPDAADAGPDVGGGAQDGSNADADADAVGAGDGASLPGDGAADLAVGEADTADAGAEPDATSTFDAAAPVPDVAESDPDAADGAPADGSGAAPECSQDVDCAGKVAPLLPCRKPACVAGQCQAVSAEDGLACEDGNACTQADACLAGVCAAGAALDCQDGNACSDDGCVAAAGCVHLANAATCSDGNACTVGDACAATACVAGPALACDDENVCSDDSCDGSVGCVHLANAATCTDGNACTTGDGCAAKACVGAALACDDGNVCTDDSCDVSAGCVHKPNTAACTDGNPCTIDTCAASACVHVAGNGGAACGSGASCQAGECLAGCSVSADCAAGLVCVPALTPGAYCPAYSDSFATDTGSWAYVGSAHYDVSAHQADVTGAVQSAGGDMWYKTSQVLEDLHAEFVLRVYGGNMGADGWSFVFQNGTNAGALGTQGSGVGAAGIVGLAVYFTHYASTSMAVWVGRTLTEGTVPIALCANAGPKIAANLDHSTSVSLVAGRLRVVMDGQPYLDCDVRDALPKSPALIGFGGGTGGSYALHAIDDVVLSHPCGPKTTGMCKPPVCGDGLVNAAGEECDDGNTAASDGCSSLCTYENDNAWGLFARPGVTPDIYSYVPYEADFGTFQSTVADTTSLVPSLPASTVYGLRAWAYVAVPTSLSFTMTKDDGAAFFINGVKVAGGTSGASVPVSATLQPGWSRLSLLVYNGYGSGYLSLSKSIGSMVQKLSSGPKK